MRDFEVRNQFATAWPALYRPFPFRPALDEFKIDTAGDAVAEMAYQVRVSPTERGRQIAILCRLEGPQAAGMVGEGQIIVERAPASTGRVALVTEASHYRHFAGWRSDPFFFGRRGKLNNLWFTGEEWINSLRTRYDMAIGNRLPCPEIGNQEVEPWRSKAQNSVASRLTERPMSTMSSFASQVKS